MANTVLLYSTYVFGTIHIIYMIITLSNNHVLNCNILFGILTSIINHKTTSELAKWTDRIMMINGIIIDIYVTSSIRDTYIQYISFYLLSQSILSFVISKIILFIRHTSDNGYSIKILNLLFHIISHLLLTLLHLLLLRYY